MPIIQRGRCRTVAAYLGSIVAQVAAIVLLLAVTKLPNDAWSKWVRVVYASASIVLGTISFAVMNMAQEVTSAQGSWLQQLRLRWFSSWRTIGFSAAFSGLILLLLFFGPEYTRLTREIVLVVSTSVLVFFFWVSAAFLMCWRSKLLSQIWIFLFRGTRNRRLVLVFAALAIWALGFGWLAGLSTLRKSSTLSTVLGGEFDLCFAEGMRQKDVLTSAITWCDWIPRRAYNFYTGSESCQGSKFSFFDRGSRHILLPPSCPRQPSGSPPRVVIENFEESDLRRILDTPELFAHDTIEEMTPYAIQYVEHLQNTYDSKTRGNVKGPYEYVVVKDDNGRIRRVELKLTSAMLRSIQISSVDGKSSVDVGLRNFIETYGTTLFHVPLLSESISVYCGSSEELHTRPILPKSNEEAHAADPSAAPPMNVVAIMIDAVSRQEVTRTLTQLKRWINAKAQLLPATHVVTESLGMTTVGHSTGGNWAPMMTGVFNLTENERQRDEAVFKLLKTKYNVKMSTSIIGGMCESVTRKFSIPRVGTGFGSQVPGYVDREYVSPLCHSSYGVAKGNFRGAYSIVKRCLAHRHVHEHVLDYFFDVVEHDVRSGVSFFHNLWLLEGHEGTHGVLKLLDQHLVDFLDALDARLEFFKNPRNALIIYSDHGNHMGPVFTWTAEGAWERTTPMSLWVLPRAGLSTLDNRRGDALGTSERHFNARMGKASTPYDMYLTLLEMFGVSSELNRAKLINSSSYFAPRPREHVSSCLDISGEDTCALSWCE